MDSPQAEVHIVLAHNGHIRSSDCWCEPSRIYHMTRNGVPLLIIEHNDETLAHHTQILAARERDRNLHINMTIDSPWITRGIDEATEPHEGEQERQ